MRETLLSHNDLAALCDRAVNAGLAIDREVLFFGINSSIRAAVWSNKSPPAAALRIEVDRLNRLVEPSEGGYLLTLWLINCASSLSPASPEAVAYFQGWAAKVDAIPVSAPLDASVAGQIRGRARVEAATDIRIELALAQLEGSIEAMSRRATNLMLSKRLHDALHKIQVNMLPFWKQGLQGFATAPDLWRSMLRNAQAGMRAECDTMESEVQILDGSDSLSLRAKEGIIAMKGAIDIADAALAAGDQTSLSQALLIIRDRLRDYMGYYAGRIENYREGLDLGLLVANLTRLAENSADPELATNAGQAAAALAAIVQDLDTLAPHHRLWQQLDAQLWVIEDQFAYLPMGAMAFTTFNFQWGKMMRALAILAGDPPATWLANIERLRDDLFLLAPVPITTLPHADAEPRFNDLILEIRRVFQGVDNRMKATCNLLREITVQLARI